MKKSEILKLVSCVPEVAKRLVGIVSIDELPQTIGHEKALIVNKDKSSEPGSHWFCLFSHSNIIEVHET